MFSLFQLFSVLFVLFIIVCAYIGRKAHQGSGEIPMGFKDIFENNEEKGLMHTVTIWLAYTFLGFTKLFDVFTVMFKKPAKTEPTDKE